MVYREVSVFGRLLKVIFLVLFVITVGVSGFMKIEDMELADAFHLTVTTVTTVGYGDLVPVSMEGRLFADFLMIFGVGIVLYASWNIISLLVEEEISEMLGMVRMQKRIKGMKNHIVVCGFGAVGSRTVEVLQGSGIKDLVVVERDAATVEEIAKKGIAVVRGDATLENVLREANLENASGFLVALNDDAENLLASMTAKDINEDIRIIARAKMPETAKKLRRIGVDRVISPEVSGGTKMARALLYPDVADFMHTLIEDTGIEIGIEEVKIKEGDGLSGRTIAEAEIRKKTGVTVIGIKKDERVVVHPKASSSMDPGNVLIILGGRNQLEDFERKYLK